jgi:hypothetical protein
MAKKKSTTPKAKPAAAKQTENRIGHDAIYIARIHGRDVPLCKQHRQAWAEYADEKGASFEVRSSEHAGVCAGAPDTLENDPND